MKPWIRRIRMRRKRWNKRKYRSFKTGSIRNNDVEQAALKLKEEPFEDLGFAKIDHHRAMRQGVAEVIYGEGKTPEQIFRIQKQ